MSPYTEHAASGLPNPNRLDFFQAQDPGLTLTYFTARLNLVPFIFVWKNTYGIVFQETVEACEVKVGTYSQINDYMTIYDGQPKVKVIH